METNHNRIKVADLETNESNRILITNEKGELTFNTIPEKTFKTISGESILGSGDIALSNKQDVSNQISVTLPATVQDSWHGKTVKFTGTGILTIPNSFINSGMCFEGITKVGTSLTWSITSPKTFEFGMPPAVSEKQIFTFMQNEGQHSIMILGL
ncbi:hypothetical protein [Flavobacterium sharifuzzamanii]|uniref:hypothetical protein n=1 Tax=Flavobacterium sharifuzzamanii TaxID=2211133 RepID=UPI000DAE4091|nr:hypothetical protein [Flavobacterium sharifuzzamanii]KAF2082127.1 hypothetical protein DMA14_06550 [Flavobacterium sharifuzzamanii]